MATNYDIDYNDSRFQEVEADKKAALNEVDVTYGNMINQSDAYFQKQIDAAQDYADKQTALQNQQTDLAIKEINQQKEQAKKDYTKEQSGAYVDWQKQSDQYGANAEQMASQGLAGAGYSESAQVSMYNTYQNRVTAARESYNLAVMNYNNSIAEARLANSSVLAEIAYNALQKQLELSLQGFQYKNQLIIEKANKKTEVDRDYYSRYQDVLKQINTENALAEEVRQYNATLAEQKRQHELEMAYKNAALAEEKRQFNVLHSGSSGGVIKGGSSGSKGGSKGGNEEVNISDNPNGGSSKQLTTYGNQSGNKLPISMGSVMLLGYGPISAAKLDSLVASGEVEEYVSGGKRKFRKVKKKPGVEHGGISGKF